MSSALLSGSDVAPGATKRCEWNRYCAFEGPLHTEHLLSVGKHGCALVGRCTSCGRFVCNRCADRRAPPAPSLAAFAAELVCPFDGESLGRGEEWIVFAERSVTRSAGLPDLAVVLDVIGGGDVDDVAVRVVADAMRRAAAGDAEGCLDALEANAKSVAARIVRWALHEEQSDGRAAWSELRALLRCAPAELVDGLSCLRAAAVDADVSGEPYLSRATRLLAAAAKGAGAPRRRGDETPVAEDPPEDPVVFAAPTLLSEARALIDLRYGRVVLEHAPRRADRALVVLCYEPGVGSQRDNVLRQVAHILREVPEIRVLAEGEPAPLRTASGDGEQPIHELLLESHGSSVLPADDRDLLGEQRRIHDSVVGSAAGILMDYFDTGIGIEAEEMVADAIARITGSSTQRYEPLLRGLEDRFKSTAVKELDDTLNRSGSAGMGPYLDAIASMSSRGISLRDYPSVALLRSALEAERSMNFNEVEGARMALVEALAAYPTDIPPDVAQKLEVWLATGSAVEHEFDRAGAGMLREEEPKRRGRIGRLFGKREAEPDPAEAPLDTRWLLRLVMISTAYRDGQMSESQYYDRLDGLLDALGLETPPILRAYMDYVMLAKSIDKEALKRIDMLALHPAARLCLAASAEEAAVYSLLVDMNHLWSVLRARLPARRARAFLGRVQSAIDPLWDAYRFLAFVVPERFDGPAGVPIVPPPAGSPVDGVLTEIRRLYEIAAERSACLVREALDAPGSIRVLVCGRFHVADVARLARERDGVCVMVVAPFGESDWWEAPNEETADPDE